MFKVRVIYILVMSWFMLSCSYKTYQPIVFSDLDQKRVVVEQKTGYRIHLQEGDKLLGDLGGIKKLETGDYLSSSEREVYKVLAAKDTIYLSNRALHFKKTHNFRDMGGIWTKDGKQVVWGHFFRSGHLAKLKKSEYAKLDRLGIELVVDLRTTKEILKKPDEIPSGVTYQNVQLYEDSEDMFSKTKKEVLKGRITPVEADSLVMEFYKLYMVENPKLVKQLIGDVFNRDSGVLFHCSAGKDRTGMVGAVILSILNVDREVILSEYMLSNNYREEEVSKRMKMAKAGKVFLPKIDYQVIENFSWIKPIYIEAMFEAIEERYGSVDMYIERALGINQEQRALYIAKYTY